MDTIPASFDSIRSGLGYEPPTVALVDSLPWGAITWPDFEVLVYRLLRREANVRGCHIYGTPGQAQEGIDIYARRKDAPKDLTCQCKHYGVMTSSVISSAVKTFLEGEWKEHSNEFILATSADLRDANLQERIKTETQALKKEEIEFVVWGRDALNDELREQPELVLDFFGRAWAIAFCGEDRMERVRGRLDRNEATKYRELLGHFYRVRFEADDRGIFPIREGAPNSVPLPERFVIPDILIRMLPPSQRERKAEEEPAEILSSEPPQERLGATPNQETPLDLGLTRRVSSNVWIGRTPRGVILGPAGSGKSSLLRMVALDTLNVFENQTLTLGEALPLWIPFAFWVDWYREHRTGDASLEAGLLAWFSRIAEGAEIAKLVQRALSDPRLILLVDGLDEAMDTEVARQALDDLVNRVNMKGSRALFTSRSEGFGRLNMSVVGWEVRELASLSDYQRRAFTHAWLLAASSEGADPHGIEIDANDFGSEMESQAELGEMTRVPLLLGVLLLQWLTKGPIPANRHDALQELTNYLLKTHPSLRSRAGAASEPKPSSPGGELPLSIDEHRDLLCGLAAEMFGSSSSAAWNRERVRDCFAQQLRDPDGMAFGPRESAHESEQVVQKLEQGLGVLVDKGSGLLGFFHRALQEHLFAAALSGRSVEDQERFIRDHGADESYHAVVVGLFGFLTREREADDFAKILLELSRSKPAALWAYAEAAILSGRLSGRGVREAVAHVADEVELGTNVERSRLLVGVLLAALSRGSVAATVVERIKGWSVRRGYSNKYVYHALRRLGVKTTNVREVLLRGMHSEDIDERRSAARAYAVLFVGDQPARDRLIDRLRHSENAGVTAALGEAAFRAWPEDPAWSDWWKIATLSGSVDMQLAGCVQAELADIHEDQVADALLELARTFLFFGTTENDIARMLTAYKNDSRVQNALLEDFTAGNRYFKSDIVESVLLSIRPLPSEVERFVIKEFSEPYSRMTMGVGKGLQSLAEDPGELSISVREAAVAWAAKADSSHNSPGLYWISKISTTEDVRDILLSRLKPEMGVQHLVNALMEGWGIEDPVVGPRLREWTSSDKNVRYVPHLARDILGDEKALAKLEECLPCNDPWLRDAVYGEVLALVPEARQEEISVEILQIDQRQPSDWSNLSAIAHVEASKVESVLSDARRRLSLGGARLEALIEGFGTTPEVLQATLEVVSPLPASLRLEVGKGLSSARILPTMAMICGRAWRDEQEVPVRSAVGAAYLLQANRAGEIDEIEIDRLRSDLEHVGGMSVEPIAAVTGLLALGRIDVLAESREDLTLRAGTVGLLGLAGYRNENPSLARWISLRWSELDRHFGPFPWAILVGRQGPEMLLDLVAQAADSILSREGLLKYLESSEEIPTGRGAIEIYESLRGGTERLRQIIDATIEKKGLASGYAREIRSRYFEAPAAIDESENWDSIITEEASSAELYRRLRDRELGTILWSDIIRISAEGPTPEDFSEACAHLVFDRFSLPEAIWREHAALFRDRVLSDPVVARATFDWFASKQTPAIKTAFASLLVHSTESTRLREWAVREYDRQMQLTIPEFGLTFTDRIPVRVDQQLIAIGLVTPP